MKYTLMNKNTPILGITIEDGTILKVDDIYDKRFLPVGINADDKHFISSLRNWWTERRIPASRNNITSSMDCLRELIDYPADTAYLTEKCLGLSLSDQYWINPQNAPTRWESINFFNNTFSEDIGKILFDNISVENPDLMSPDNTSDGQIRKKWKIINNERCLIKGYSLPYKQEPFNEEAASIVCQYLGIESYIPYTTVIENGKPSSVCKDFITVDTELVTANALIMAYPNSDKNTSVFNHYRDICVQSGIKDIDDRLDEMLTLDYLIGNYDRHFRNFGLIRNVETLAYISSVPIFDSGTSMKYNIATEEMFNDNEYKLKSKPFRSTHHEQIKLVKHPERFEIDKLKGTMLDEIRAIYNKGNIISEQRVNYICAFLKQRITSLDKAFCKNSVSFTERSNVSELDRIMKIAHEKYIEQQKHSQGQSRDRDDDLSPRR